MSDRLKLLFVVCVYVLMPIYTCRPVCNFIPLKRHNKAKDLWYITAFQIYFRLPHLAPVLARLLPSSALAPYKHLDYSNYKKQW